MQPQYRTMPFFMSIEPADFCNLHCPECPVGMRTNGEKEKLTMPFSLFKKTIDEAKQAIFHVIFYFQGEPLLHKNLPEMIKYAHENKIFTSTSTNAQVLNENMAKMLVQSGLDKLIVSIDGSTQASYETYRVGGNLQKAIDGVKNVVKYKTMFNKKTPIIEIQCLVLRSNENQMQEMKMLTKMLGADYLHLKTAQFYDFENGNALMPENDFFSRYKKDYKTGKYLIKKPLRNRCWRAWNAAVITAKGEILPCCFDKNAKFSFGNILEKTLSECYNSEKSHSFRCSLLKNRRQFTMCRNCSQ